MQKFDHRSIIYGTMGIKERVTARQDKWTIRVRAIEILLYMFTSMWVEKIIVFENLQKFWALICAFYEFLGNRGTDLFVWQYNSASLKTP